MANIKSGKAKINYKDDLSAEARNLIQSILKENPKDRIKLDEIFSHKWITSLDQKYGLNLRRYTEGGAKNSNPDQKAEDKNYKNLQEKNFANDDYLNKLIDERNNEKNKKPTVSFKDKKFINLSESSLNKFGNYKMPVRQDSSLDKPILKNNTSNLNKTKKFDHLKNWNSTDPETGGYISDRQVIKGFMTKADKGQKRLLTEGDAYDDDNNDSQRHKPSYKNSRQQNNIMDKYHYTKQNFVDSNQSTADSNAVRQKGFLMDKGNKGYGRKDRTQQPDEGQGNGFSPFSFMNKILEKLGCVSNE